MIKKKTEKVSSNKEDSISKKISVFLKSERTHFVIGILCVMFGVYLFIAFLSFFYTGNADQSKLENLPLNELSSIKNEIRNWTGAFGAYLSDLLINRWVGISAFFISFFIAKVGLKLMKVKDFSITKSLVYTCSLIILGSLICGFFFIDNYKDSYLFLGGYHGYYMTLLLQANIGWTGTLLFILTGILIFLVAISAKTVPFLRKIFLLDIKRKKNIEVSESEDNKIYQTSLENKDLVNKPIPISEVLNSDIEDETDMAESEGCTDKTDHHEENFFEIVPKQEETLVKEDTIQEDRSGEPEFVIEENIQEEEETSNSEEL